MNSYPIELLVQHAPLMFVAGLELPKAKQDPFYALITRLREVLGARPKGLVWDKHRSSAFNILLVDKDMKFPPRKVVATTEQGPTSPHSPLSPLIPSSPLYPDGLIAPVWVRKHVELVPSIFVLFLRLWEAPPPLSPLEGREQEMEEERFHDQELATELTSRKRALAERGIKLTAVLLASRKLLDDPGLDSRLTFLRRQSSLDARAALFVLSPVSTNELQDFVRSLTEALREPSLEYYAAHSKRVRRKRNKHANSAYSGYPSAVATTRSVPLRPIGWTVRYEYKMGTFAEFRFEEEVARKHYEDCWNGLSEMFTSVTVLPPRTKRWAEAKVLADCVAIKIYKLYLYNNEHSLALSYFHRHVQRFCDLSKGWGIGEDTFEYWSWLARQYRILAELLEIALRAGLRLPSLLPQQVEERAVQQLMLEPIPVPGRRPFSTLQHPGFYYFQAAKCTEERLKRFKAIEEAETRQMTLISQAPAFNNEKKVDHWEVILELYSKAYEQFKRYAAGQSRLTFFIAVQIATTYHASGKHDLAVKFFERIVKVYHKERWPAMLRPILAMWYDSARSLGDIETCIRLLFERMTLCSQMDNASLAANLEAILTTTEPAPDSQPLHVELSPAEQILRIGVVFYEKEVSVGKSTPFQIQITTPDSTCLHFLPVTSLTFHLSNDLSPIIVNHARQDQPARVIALGDVEVDGKDPVEVENAFTLTPGATQVLHGSASTTNASVLKIIKVTLKIAVERWVINVDFDPSTNFDFESKWLYSPDDDFKPIPLNHAESDPTSIMFRASSHDFQVDIKHAGIALVGENYPITITVQNEDMRSLEMSFDVLLQPSENETGKINYISIGDERSTNFLRSVSFGTVEPGAHAEKIILLNPTGAPGRHILDFSIQSRTNGELAVNTDPATENEILRTIIVDSQEPFGFESHVTYGQPQDGLPAFPNVMNLNDLDPLSSQANVTTTIECLAGCELEITNIRLLDLDISASHLLFSSLSSNELEHMYWIRGDQFAVDTCIGIQSSDTEEFQPPQMALPSPVQIEVTWRRAKVEGAITSFTSTMLPLPELRPPVIGLTVIIDPPAVVKLHVPFPLSLKIRNNDSHRSADLAFALEPTDGFVAAGFRSGALPLLLPGTEDTLSFNLIPLISGLIKLPTFRVHRTMKIEPTSPGQSEDGSIRGAPLGDAVPVVDERWNETDEAGNNVHFYAKDGTALTTELDLTLWLSVLVVPRLDPWLLRKRSERNISESIECILILRQDMSNIIPIPEYDYEVVTGWFVQDEPAALVHELPHGFGMLDPSEQGWEKLKDHIEHANGEGRTPGTVHKLFLLARHGQGWHNVAESMYGKAEWDQYWSKLNGNGTIVWGPDPELTTLGIKQAEAANAMWREHTKLGLPAPDVIYTSPFRRSIQTSIITLNGWFYPDGGEHGTEASKSVNRIVIEDLHETGGVHTCDMRNPKSVIQQEFPSLVFEDGFVEDDPLWNLDHRETWKEQDVRARRALNKMMTADGTYIYVSSHSGTMRSLLRILGHQPYDVTPGGVVPVLVKATQRSVT